MVTPNRVKVQITGKPLEKTSRTAKLKKKDKQETTILTFVQVMKSDKKMTQKLQSKTITKDVGSLPWKSYTSLLMAVKEPNGKVREAPQKTTCPQGFTLRQFESLVKEIQVMKNTRQTKGWDCRTSIKGYNKRPSLEQNGK